MSILPLNLINAPSLADPRPLVIYHGGGCPDGFASALAAWLFYAGQAEFIGLDHGDVKSAADLPDVAGRAVYILDFSFSPELMRSIDERAAKFVMLDHHKSAAESLSGFVCRCGEIHFDMKKSGARLAWEFFQAGKPLPDLVKFVEDRDIWVWQLPASRPCNCKTSWHAARPWMKNSANSPLIWRKMRALSCSTASAA
jgi:uncharacterized protein